MYASLFLTGGDLITVLTAYFDESYNHRTQKNPDDPLVYTVGCWLSTAQKWLLFGKKWRFALNKAGVDFFHMTDFEARRGEYGLWSNSKRISVLKELHRVIKDHVVFGCSSSVVCADFDAVITTLPQYTHYFGKSYYEFNARVCMHKLKDWFKEKDYDGTVDYVFADLAGQGAALDRMFREALNHPEVKKRFRLSGMWAKGRMREVVQIQAADVVTYELNKRVVDELKAGQTGERHIRKSLENLHLSKNFAPLYFNREEMERMAVESFTGLAI